MATSTRPKGGRPLSIDLRELIIKKMVNFGADATLNIKPPGACAAVARQLEIDRGTVRNIWNRYCATKSLIPSPYIRHKSGKLLEEHKQYIMFLVQQTPPISLGTIKEKLSAMCDLDISIPAICGFLKKETTRKLLTRPAAERFTDENLMYTRAFLTVMRRTDPKEMKFFDESGFHRPDVSNPRYDRSIKGERAIEIQSRTRTKNVTLNLLIGIDGVCHVNILDGASNVDTFIEFIFSALNSTTNYGDFALRPGDFLILNNCPIHRFRAEDVLSRMLERFGIEYIFLPTYSPHLNPVELCFNHVKSLMKSDDIRSVAKDNLEYAIMCCVNSITSDDCMGYYSHVGYLRM